MATIVTGRNNRSIPQPTERGEMDRFGVDSITREEFIPAAELSKLLRAKGSAHPRFNFMSLSRRSYQLGMGGAFYKVTYLYEGFIESMPEPTYELNGAVREEPIQTHEDFEEVLAGTPSAPANGAKFIDPETGKPSTDNDAAVFDRFGRGPLEGVSEFRTPAATWTVTRFATSRPTTARDLGKIDNPDGSPPSFGSDRNWMFIAMSYRQRGFVYEIRETWELSGRGGWNTLLY